MTAGRDIGRAVAAVCLACHAPLVAAATGSLTVSLTISGQCSPADPTDPGVAAANLPVACTGATPYAVSSELENVPSAEPGSDLMQGGEHNLRLTVVY